MTDLAELNDAPAEGLRPRLLALTASPHWADSLLGSRPFEDMEALLAASDDLIAALEESEIDAALAGHPRIGQEADQGEAARGEGHGVLDEESSARSAREQSGMDHADSALREAMARGNAAYEDRFGRIYLVAAAGRSAEELLSILQQRLLNDSVTELDVVRRELATITRLRLSDSWESR